MPKITVEYEVSEEQVERLKALLPYCQRVEAFKNWTEEDVLQLIMKQGSTYAIDSKLDFVERIVAAQSETPAMGVAGESKVADK